MKLITIIDTPIDADGGTVGIRDAVAMAIEGAGLGAVRFIAPLPEGRATVRKGERVMYTGACDFIPCDRRGACLEGMACAGCAHADVLARLAAFEDAAAAMAEVVTDARAKK